MPRNGSGMYNLPAGNPVVFDTPIEPSWANNTLTDIAAALTASIATDGQSSMAAPLALSAGSAALPALTKSGDPNTGLYFPGADSLALTVGGTAKMTVDTSLTAFGATATAAQNRVRVYGHSNADCAPVAELNRSGAAIWSLSGLSAALSFGVGAAGYSDAQLLAAEKLRLESTFAGVKGHLNVGVAAVPTTYPGGYTTVQATGTTATEGGLVRVQSAAAEYSAEFTISSSFGAGAIRTVSNHALQFLVNTTVKCLTLTTAGNTVTGDMAASGVNFEVTKNSAADTTARVRNTAGNLDMTVLAAGGGQIRASAGNTLALGAAAATGLTFDTSNNATFGQNVVSSKATAPSFGATANVDLVLLTNNTEKLRLTNDGRLYGTALHNNAGAVTGAVNQYIASGTYTPTGTAVTNCSSPTAFTTNWHRVGNTVSVSGVIQFSITAANTATEFAISLPIASNINGNAALGGVGAPADNAAVTYPLAIQGDAANDRAQVKFRSHATGTQAYSFNFQYEVI